MLGLYNVIPILILDFFHIIYFNIITTLWYVTLKTVKEFGCLIKRLYKGNRIAIKYQNYIEKIHKQELKYVESNFYYLIEMFENTLQGFFNQQ